MLFKDYYINMLREPSRPASMKSRQKARFPEEKFDKEILKPSSMPNPIPRFPSKKFDKSVARPSSSVSPEKESSIEPVAPKTNYDGGTPSQVPVDVVDGNVLDTTLDGGNAYGSH